jgi:hypothetical protein
MARTGRTNQLELVVPGSRGSDTERALSYDGAAR